MDGELELLLQAADMLVGRLAVGQDLAHEIEPSLPVHGGDFVGRRYLGLEEDLRGGKAVSYCSLEEPLERVVPHFPFGLDEGDLHGSGFEGRLSELSLGRTNSRA